jgi:hypothetical protein
VIGSTVEVLEYLMGAVGKYDRSAPQQPAGAESESGVSGRSPKFIEPLLIGGFESCGGIKCR